MLACRIKEDVVASFSVIITILLAQNLHPAECSLLPALGSSKQSLSKGGESKVYDSRCYHSYKIILSCWQFNHGIVPVTQAISQPTKNISVDSLLLTLVKTLLA